MADNKKPPNCPNCQTPMTLAHVIPRMAGHPEIQSFKCRSCDEVLTEVEDEE